MYFKLFTSQDIIMPHFLTTPFTPPSESGLWSRRVLALVLDIMQPLHERAHNSFMLAGSGKEVQMVQTSALPIRNRGGIGGERVGPVGSRVQQRRGIPGGANHPCARSPSGRMWRTVEAGLWGSLVTWPSVNLPCLTSIESIEG